MDGIKIDFYPHLKTPRELYFFDMTRTDMVTNYRINTLTFTLQSKYLPNQLYNVDVMPYIYTQREHREWYKVTSDMVGINEGQPIPDGVYSASFLVNNMYTTTHTFIVYQTIEKEIKTLLSSAGFRVDSDEVNLLYQNSDKYDFETLSILYSLLGAIERNALDANITGAEEALIKAQRILQTIETEPYIIT